jgi:biopolymer transport protein ExbD
MSTKKNPMPNTSQKSVLNYWHLEPNDAHRQTSIMSEINMMPLIDVMLVLLIVFMVTLPVIHQALKIELPNAPRQTTDTIAIQAIDLVIDAQGKIYWNQILMDQASLAQKMQSVTAQAPEIQLRADRATRYEYVAEVMVMAQKNGLNNLNIITQPTDK